MKRFFLILGIVLLLGTIAYINIEPAPVTPCTNQPCIKLAEPTGAFYKLNDFKFLPNHCISFVSLPDHAKRNYCGQYNLTWIGPDSANTKGLAQ